MTQAVNTVVMALSSSVAAAIVAKATFVVAMALIVIRLARRSCAAVRHAVLAASFAVLLVLPIASIVAPPVSVALPVATHPVAASPFPETAFDTVQSDRDGNTRVAATAARWPKVSLSDALLAAWLAGVALFLLPIVRGMGQVRALRRSGLPWPPGQSIADALARDAGIHRRVEVFVHDSLPGPMTCGVEHPAIVLPSDAKHWDAEDLSRAIVHELEHVRRGDWVSHCLSRLVCALYWFHPLVWMAWRQLGLEAERSCDDAVLRRSEATAYADQLVGLAQRLSESPALAMASRADLAKRVGALLDGRQRRGRAGKILVALACATATALVLTMSPLRLIATPQSALQFEVASIKPTDPAAMHSSTPRVYPGGRVVMEARTLKSLVYVAFHLSYWQISGGDAWTDKDLYDLEAKPPAGLQPEITNLRHSNFSIEDERLQEMLQGMLIDRFHLKFHRETKMGKVYLLEKTGKPVGLRPTYDASLAKATEGFSGDVGFAGGRWVIFNTTMPQLAKFAGDFILHATVLDRTGLTGSFDYKQPNRLSDSEVDYGNPPFLQLMPELGLKLESAQGPVESFVIDHADRPSPN